MLLQLRMLKMIANFNRAYTILFKQNNKIILSYVIHIY